MSENTIACIEKMVELWTYEDVLAEWIKQEYNWGLTHGDFHPGQIMVNPDDYNDLIFLDWEFAGVNGNPAIDMVTWTAEVAEKYFEATE